ncbi:hypothetical protein [Hyphomicrobium sp.]|uniref:hypothetical protein n=1 Tax=Hyphomicrobium sp. TaxID=82 RepID=UPI002D7867FA|nr:hypothetical protein [Hyphomicrobium sp.]HET6389253.1 hypothetical protein [Hyphomicrobium sp.]
MYEDDWLVEFNNRATPRLREIFKRELDGIPPSMRDLLDRLGTPKKRKRAPVSLLVLPLQKKDAGFGGSRRLDGAKGE